MSKQHKPKKGLTDQKSALLNRGNYGIFPLEIVQHTVGEITASGENGGKVIALWFYLLGHVNNVPYNPRFGYAFPKVSKIAKDLKISRNAIKSLCDVLERFGLLETKIETHVSTDGKLTQTKLYKPLFPSQTNVPQVLNPVEVVEAEAVSDLDGEQDEFERLCALKFDSPPSILDV